jgi:hypothetical protein
VRVTVAASQLLPTLSTSAAMYTSSESTAA